MKSLTLLAPLALLSASALVAALPSHPGRRQLQARNRALGVAILDDNGDYADLSGTGGLAKRDVVRADGDGALVKRKTTTKRKASSTKKVAAAKVNTKSLAAYSTSSKKAAAVAAISSKKAAAAVSASKLASAAAATSSKKAAAAASAASVASVKSASLAEQSTTTKTATKTASPTTTQFPAPKTTTTTTRTPTPTADAASALQSLALSEHNSFRAQHAAPALTWNATLAAGAQEWADRCVFEHGEGAKYGWGENLSAFTGSANDIQDGIVLWEDEAPDYDPSNPVASHFTQLVWKDSQQLGCAFASCPPGSIFDASYGSSRFFVCEYYPPGNYLGEFSANVQK